MSDSRRSSQTWHMTHWGTDVPPAASYPAEEDSWEEEAIAGHRRDCATWLELVIRRGIAQIPCRLPRNVKRRPSAAIDGSFSIEEKAGALPSDSADGVIRRNGRESEPELPEARTKCRPQSSGRFIQKFCQPNFSVFCSRKLSTLDERSWRQRAMPVG